MKKSPQIHLLVFVALALARSAAAAPITLDCTAGCVGQPFGGAIFSTASVQSSGTGVFNPFVRIQQAPSEQGVNTDGALTNDEKAGTWTHSVLTADLDNIFNIGGTTYYEFMLDLGEPATDKQSLISLDRIELCTAASATLTSGTEPNTGCPTTPAYSLDTGQDRSVLLDYNLFGGGNGNSDLFFYVPTSVLGANPDTYFYMFTAFGHQPGFESQGSFEEWAFRDGPPPPCIGCVPTPNDFATPEPASLVLLGSGLLGLAAYRRRKGRRN